VLIGEAREKIRGSVGDIVKTKKADSLEEAVINARNMAKSGESVLLSPMCASFDMFDDYKHRGRVFKKIVKGL